jgi:cytidylate kinase
VAASRVASIPEVRNALRDFQQQFARQPGGAVLDGRDIGTVIAPAGGGETVGHGHAAEVRAHRRFLELSPKRPDLTRGNRSCSELVERDSRDAPNMVRARCALARYQPNGIEQAFRAAVAMSNVSGKVRVRFAAPFFA